MPGRFEILQGLRTRADAIRPYDSNQQGLVFRTVGAQRARPLSSSPSTPATIDSSNQRAACRGGLVPPAGSIQLDPQKLDAPIVLDGAHNGDSATALAKTLASVFPEQPVLFILGVNQDKNLEEIWGALKGTACAVIATRSENYRSIPPEELGNRILACDPLAKVIIADNIDKALEQAAYNLPEKAVICLCGSLYLVAEARERLILSPAQ